MMTDITERGDRERAEIVHPDPINENAQRYEIIDTDVHFLPDWDVLRGYMPEPFRSKLTRYPLVGADFSPQYSTGVMGTGQEVLGTARTAEDMLKTMDELNTDTVMLVPGFQRPQSLYHKAWVSVLSAAYNDYLVDKVLPASDRIKAEIMVNHRDPEAGAAEIKRVGDQDGFISVYTEYGGNYEPIGTADHDPIFEAAVERDLAITIHAGCFWQQMTPVHQGTRTWTELLGIASCGITMASVGAMIMQGLFDKFPDLHITVKEGGFWWIPEFALRGDDFYLSHPGDISLVERKVEAGEEFLAKLPSEYLFENFRFSSQPMCLPKDPKHFQMLWELCKGEDMLLYSSDWPHATFDPPNWVFENALITEEARVKILSGNARTWFPRLG
jgi:predicted TIM-barrel fold metal-dependent hydrolase